MSHNPAARGFPRLAGARLGTNSARTLLLLIALDLRFANLYRVLTNAQRRGLTLFWAHDLRAL
jgi:hypothetical protein